MGLHCSTNGFKCIIMGLEYLNARRMHPYGLRMQYHAFKMQPYWLRWALNEHYRLRKNAP